MKAPSKGAARPSAAAQLKSAQDRIKGLEAKLEEQHNAAVLRHKRQQETHYAEIHNISESLAQSIDRERRQNDTIEELKNQLMELSLENARMAGYIGRAVEDDPAPPERRFGHRDTITDSMTRRQMVVRQGSAIRTDDGVAALDRPAKPWWNRS